MSDGDSNGNGYGDGDGGGDSDGDGDGDGNGNGDGMLNAMMATASYGDVVAKTRTYLHRQLAFSLSDTSFWIQRKYKKLKYIHT